ncbi:hypothetical protein TRFO_07247 [Tritrichomonas foetus]|uniref:Uncharacterized protein n=1 Tax=Tritrichomonas foetus TaxID=1144522 RepID=A0A1J4JTK3_9EUKA|nr:hypothetical protein TRFO_07247 [Tritrichomonas foetus]|eukprot:OHT02074.1 hypothetical protein TRFO_07247 [Tritrichomonas foetus]
MLEATDVVLPSGYMFKEMLDETLDSINVLALDKKNDFYSIRIFPNDKSPNSEKIISTIKKWNNNFSPKRNELYNRILVFETKDEGGNYYCWHKFCSRTLEFLCFYGDDVFDEEKDAICIQLIDLLDIVKDYEPIPIFPSRLILKDDLYIQLSDLYPPNPIDEEAFLMGWFQPGATNESFIIKIIGLLWRIDDEKAKEKFIDYKNNSGSCPKWSKEFLTLHISDTSTIRKSNIPPILALDLVRSKVNSGVRSADHFAASYGITEMIYLVGKLTKQMIQVRVLPITLDLLKVNHDTTKSLILLLVLQILDTIGFEIVNSKNMNISNRDQLSLTGLQNQSSLYMQQSMQNSGDQNDQQTRNRLDLPTFTDFIKSILSSEFNMAKYTFFCVLPRIIRHIGFDEAKSLIIKLISIIRQPENDHLKVIFCLNFTRIMKALGQLTNNSRPSSLKPFICQLLSIKISHVQAIQASQSIQNQDFNIESSTAKEADEFLFKPSDQLLQSLLTMQPELYNLDAMIERMPSQLMTQTQLRYLIKNIRFASPSMLFKFNVVAALPLIHISSLSQAFIRKLKTVVHPADYNALIPADAESYFLTIPNSAPPIEDTMLEIVRPFISKKLFEYNKSNNHRHVTTKSVQSVNTILELGSIKDFSFTLDGKGVLVCSDNNVRRYNSNFTSLDYHVLFTTNEVIEKVVTFPDSFVISGSDGPQRFGFMRFYYDNKARNQSHSYDSPITALSRFESNDYVFFGLKNGDIYFNTPLSQKDSLHIISIGENLGAPISIVEMPNSPNFVISTNEGNAIIYDMRIQTPLKRFRACNRPAYVVPCDSSNFWMTCGPFCTKFDIKNLQIKQAISCSSSHVVGCCCVGDWVITAHTDLSMFAVNEKASVVNLNTPNGMLSYRKSDKFIKINPGDSVPLHEHQINCIKASPTIQAAVTSDISGRMIMWATPVSKKGK